MEEEDDDEEQLLHSVALQNAQSILLARQRAEEELLQAKEALERKTEELAHSLALMRATEQALQKQSEWLRVTLASIGDAVITTDTEGCVTSLNPVAELLTGWAERDAQGEPLGRVFAIVNEDSREVVENPALRSLREGEIVGLANHTILIARDGTERAIDDSAAPIKDAEGTILGVVLIFRDVSERRRDEDRLRQSEAQFRQLADALPHLVWTARPDGFIDYYNERWYEFTGFPRNEPESQRWKPILHPDDVEACLDTYDAAIRSGTLYRSEYRFRDRRTGGYRWFLGQAYPVRDKEGQIVRWFGTCTDIDETKQATAALQESDRRKDEFLAMLAHELRNPLAPIRHGVQIFRAQSPPVPELQWATDVIDRQVHQMTRLVDDLLDVSRITRDKIELRKERVDLAAILHCAVEDSRPLLEKHGHELNVTLPSEPIEIEADLTRLSQVLLNLINNAAKFMDRAGRIWVTAERQGDFVQIRVKDAGIGIRPEMLPRIFDMFTQVDRSLERSEGGLGIGLTLVKRLVEMHGGTVLAQSEGPGRGSEFIVCLPVAAAVPGDGSREAAGLGEKAAPATRRILIVDDNRDAADSLGTLLKMLGNEVHTAYDGLEAVEAVAAFQPDMVLLDIGLPKLNGYEAARRIREQEGGTSLVLIALTGWGQEEDRRLSKEAGFDHHVTKPVEFAHLKKLIAETRTSPLERRRTGG